MKKCFLLVLLIGIFGISFAQDTGNSWSDEENYVRPGETKIITQDLNSDNIAELQKVQARFCNDKKATKDLKLRMRPWQREDICVVLANQSDKPTSVLFWFSKGILKNWAPICDADMTAQNEFAKYILWNTTTWIMIPASGSIIQTFTYVAPTTASWDMLGCIGYKINKQEQIEPGKMFLIVPRKVGYIYLNITWSVYQFWRRDDMKYGVAANKSGILKIITAIIAVWLAVTIFQTTKKKEKHHKK